MTDSVIDIALACAAAGWHVFPIRAGAKVPLTPNGFKDATTRSAVIAEWGAAHPGCNWAVACGASDLLVVDADPRNGASVDAVGAELPRTLSVATGGGGRHWYFKGARKVPAKLAPGVDLKSEGGYVLLPGSVTNGRYDWADIAPIAQVPQIVLNAMDERNPPRTDATDSDCPEVFELSAEWAELAKVELAAMPAARRGDGGTPLLRAAAVAIRGWLLDLDTADALLREVWCPRCEPPWTFDAATDEKNWWHTLQRAADIGDVEWGSRRPLVGLDAAVSVAAWNASRAAVAQQREDGVDVVATPTVVPRPPYNMTVPAEAWVEWMNGQFTVMTSLGASGKVRIAYWIDDATSAAARHPRQSLVLQGKDDFLLKLKHTTGFIEGKVDEKGAPDRVAIAPWWLQRFDRAEATRLCFRPDLPARGRVNGQMNLWRGYGIAPAAGDWSLLREHLRAYVARGDETHFDYIVRWMAWVLQNPGERADVVLVFKGTKGSGKNTAFDSLCMMLGQHGKAVANPKHFTGNFNAHLQDCALLFANEAIPPNDKAAEGVLKSLVTDGTLAIERKGVDVEHAENCLSVCMASNERWCVPASLDERRFAVFEIDPDGRRDVVYWTALHRQLDEGGRAAMLHDLLELDLTAWHPRNTPPKTEALVEQQLHGLRGADAVVYQMLAEGENAGALPGIAKGPDAAQGVFVCTRILADATASKEGVMRRLNDLATALAKACRPEDQEGARYQGIAFGGSHRVRGFVLPPLAQARQIWAETMGVRVAWTGPDDWT